MRTKHLAYSILLFIFWLALASSDVYACFNPTDFFAAEVLLNKPGVKYELGRFKVAVHVVIKDETITYRSHYNADVAVILGPIKKPLAGLSVRIQIPTKTVDGKDGPDLASAVNIDKGKFDFQSAMKVELEWLVAHGIITGITDVDIKGIVARAKAGISGWNSRIVYENGEWLPYNETANPLMLRDKLGCGGFSINGMPEGQLVFPSVAVSIKGKMATMWAKTKSGGIHR